MTEPTNRRDFMTCLAWAGTGVLWTLSSGAASSAPLEAALGAQARPGRVKPFTFLQISDTHIGFMKDANPDARVTLRETVAKIKALPQKPDFILHTGDLTQLSKPQEYDDLDQIMRETGVQTFYVPGEHDTLDEGRGKAFLDRYGKGALGDGWYSFDHAGVHFIALVNVKMLDGMGHMGEAQLAWLKDDLAGRPASQPIVVFAHIPLWMVYQPWGWGTDDAAQALALLARFGSVTVLNGHIHQVIEKTEGNMTFHTARSTAFPQPAPGAAASAGPMKVDPLRAAIGLRSIQVKAGRHDLAVIDQTLA